MSTRQHVGKPYLFRPGWGAMPPYLAGRETEQRLLKKHLACLQRKESPPAGTVLIGPRGNGKTVLMRWFEQEINAAEKKPDVVWLTPDEVPDLDSLANRLVPSSRFRKTLPGDLALSLGPVTIKGSWQLDGSAGALTDLLTARCARRPLALLLDEAHNLEQEVGRILLNTTQKLVDRAPFLLVMAGTPNLESHLNAIDATFWERCQPVLGVGRLDQAATREALLRPLNAETPKITFEEDALQQVVSESQQYPYFVQLWGEALWQQVQDSGVNRIDEAVVDWARPEFDRSKTTFYEFRYKQFNQGPLLEAAKAVAVAFTRQGPPTDAELNQVVAAALPDGTAAEQVDAVSKRLHHLGYIWTPPGSMAPEPGIPSLMDYVQAKR